MVSMSRAPGAMLAIVGRNAPFMLAGGVFLGLAFPALASLLRPLMVPAIAVPLVLALVRIDWRLISAYGRRPGLLATIVVWLMVVTPVLTWALLQPLGLPPDLTAGLTLMAAAPPIISSAAIALFIGLEAELIIVVIGLTLAITPVTLPVIALVLLGLDIDVSLGTFMLRLVLFIGGGFFIAGLIKRWTPADWIARNAHSIDGVSVTSMLVFAIAVMDGVTAFMFENPDYFIAAILAGFAANLLLQALGTGLFWPLGRRKALSVGMMTGNCNMGLVIAVLADKAPLEVIVFFAVAQVPIYILPAALLRIYRRVMASEQASPS